MSETWRTLTDTDNETTESLRIPGGWLHRTTVWNDDRPSNIATALTFQPESAE